MPEIDDQRTITVASKENVQVAETDAIGKLLESPYAVIYHKKLLEYGHEI